MLFYSIIFEGCQGTLGDFSTIPFQSNYFHILIFICRLQEPEIVKLQAFVRSNKAKHDYRALSKYIKLQKKTRKKNKTEILQ